MQPHVSCLRPSHHYLLPVHNSPLALFICIEVGAAGQVYLIQTSIWSGKSHRAGKLAISPKIKTKQTTTTKKVHQVSQTSAFEIRSTISALKLLSCNITKVETHSSQREGGRRGGEGEVGDLSCQSKKNKQKKPNQKPSSHTFKKKSVCSEKNKQKNKQQQQKRLAAQSSECYLKKPKTKQNKNKQKVVHSSLNLLRVLCMSWHVI